MDQQTGMLRLGCDTRLDREIKEDYLFHMKAEDTAGHTVSYQMGGGGQNQTVLKAVVGIIVGLYRCL